MSEIFEALRKAQKNITQEADAERPPVHLPSAWVQDEGAPDFAAPPPARAGEHGASWWHRLRARTRGSSNGHAEAESPLVLQTGTLLAEQFRLLRTRVEMAGAGTVMITSALDNEGKTVCAINLAKALSMSIGRGVLLIDADLRHPSVAHLLGVSTHPGLVDYLTGEVDWRACLQTVDTSGMQLIPAGTSSSLAPELLGSPRLPRLIEELKESFPDHHIVFDAPPLLLTVDPLVLARHIEHVLLVVRANVTPRAAVMKALESLGPERLRGIVFNAAQEQLGHYYYRNYYYGVPGKADDTESAG